ncbi:MAG: hypothetical protein K0R63_1660 [Rickettsiales bacterium]|jgi:glycosyltransferase involved in cell wall biosynthesis|nr:hypothetical protein [Rickettsiales bacterium]
MTQASVAIITRTKNRPLLLKRAIKSVIGQTFQDWVMVIVNDGGDPAPVNALVEEYREAFRNRVKVLHHETSLGMEAASNRGISASKSTYVTIHDDDDAWHPDFLKTTVSAIESNQLLPNLGGAVTTVIHIEEEIDGDTVSEVRRARCDAWVQEMTVWNIYAGNFFPPIAFLYKREAYNTMQRMYREELPVLGDWDFNLAFFQHFNITHIDQPHAYYHTRVAGRHDIYSNTTTDGNYKHDAIRTALKNQALRDDLTKNQLGHGFLLNIAPSLKKLEDTTARTESLLKHVPTPIEESFARINIRLDHLNERLDRTDAIIHAIYHGMKLLGTPIRLVKKAARKLTGTRG